MTTDLSTYSVSPLPAAVVACGDDYKVTIGQSSLTLQRDVDFGKIPGTKKPTLYKGGAERIVMSYGVSTNFTVERAVENVEGNEPFFFYLVRCSFDKAMPDGSIVHITDGYGSANTNEKKCGRASKWDLANTQLKIAKKRALVDGALLLGQLSNMFGQDIENEDFMEDAATKITNVPDGDSPITSKQVQRIYAIAAHNGMSTKQAKEIIATAGFASTKDITQDRYDEVCALLSKREEAEDDSER